MTEPTLLQTLDNLDLALARLQGGLARSVTDDDLVLDGVLQRFEFTWELAWKATGKVLARHGISAGTPRAVMTAAYVAGWIDDDEAWLEMQRDRNQTAHVYDEAQARAVLARLPRWFAMMAALRERLRAESMA